MKTRATREMRPSNEIRQRAPACNTLSVWNRKITHAGQTQKKMLCRLTLELSGGGAVRLNDLLGRRPATPNYGLHDSPAFNVRQCLDGDGVRKKNALSAMKSMMPSTALDAAQREAKN
ncbi:hypothetical protein [Rhodanobacter sp. BL-MT-08]